STSRASASNCPQASRSARCSAPSRLASRHPAGSGGASRPHEQGRSTPHALHSELLHTVPNQIGKANSARAPPQTKKRASHELSGLETCDSEFTFTHAFRHCPQEFVEERPLLFCRKKSRRWNAAVIEH